MTQNLRFLQEVAPSTYQARSGGTTFHFQMGSELRMRVIQALDQGFAVADRFPTGVTAETIQRMNGRQNIIYTDDRSYVELVAALRNIPLDSSSFTNAGLAFETLGVIWINRDIYAGPQAFTYIDDIPRVVWHENRHLAGEHHGLRSDLENDPKNARWLVMMERMRREFIEVSPTIIDPITGRAVELREKWVARNDDRRLACFLAGTPILMADGQEKPIEDIRVGDMVMSFDPSADQGRGALVPKPVSRTFQNVTRSIIDLRGLYMTPGHVCLTDDGRFETIAEILLRDGILIEADGTPIRARTGAKVGSMEDTPVLIAYPDEKTGKEIFVRARAGIPCCLIRERDGTKRHLSLALMLRAYHQTLTPEGLILSPDGSLGEATDWPEDSTPMDADYRRNWVIQTADGKPYVPEWIAAVAGEAREEQTVGATLQRIISPPSQRFTPRVVDNPTPPARNRAERRAQKHRGPK